MELWQCQSGIVFLGQRSHILIQQVVVGLTSGSQTGNVQQIYHCTVFWCDVQSHGCRVWALECSSMPSTACSDNVPTQLIILCYHYVTYKWLVLYRLFLSMTKEPKTYASKKLEANVILSRSRPLPFLPLSLHSSLPSPSPSPTFLSPSLPPVTQYWFLEGHWSCQYRRNKDEVELLMSHSVCGCSVCVCVDVVCVCIVCVRVCGMCLCIIMYTCSWVNLHDHDILFLVILYTTPPPPTHPRVTLWGQCSRQHTSYWSSLSHGSHTAELKSKTKPSPLTVL